MTTLIFGRITFATWTLGGDKQARTNRLVTMIRDGEKYDPRGNFYWAFGDFQPISTNDDEEIYFGRLCRVYKDVVQNFYDDVHKTVIRDHLKNKGDYSNFVFIPKANVVVFEEKRPSVTINNFINAFSRIYKDVYVDDLSYIKIEPFIETRAISELISQYDKVIKVKLRVMPTNPDDDPVYRPLDKMLKDATASSGTLEFKNENTGVKISGTVIEQGMLLGDAGYGDYELTVIRGLQERTDPETIKSTDKIKRVNVENPENPVEIGELYSDIFERYYANRHAERTHNGDH